MAATQATDLNELAAAFKVFSSGADKMKLMYSRLEERVTYLTGELDRKNRELEKARRLASLVELAAGVAHEIRNPLGGIELSATMLRRELGADAASKDLVENIIEGVRRLNGIVVSLLHFTRATRLQAREFDLMAALSEASGSVAAQHPGSGVSIRLSGGQVGMVLGDPDQLRQVFVNLAQNAFDAMPEGGQLSIDASPEPESTPAACRIVFRDTGTGISPEHAEKLFQPFFSTRETGTGLGLAISHKIVQDHGGRIAVSSRRGNGAEFTIFLPIQFSDTEQGKRS